jgi:2-amino-4-hydroxy-6-hydroxymethyldihydropteridine diphosphokinase
VMPERAPRPVVREVQAFVALGSNMGDRAASIAAGVRAIGSLPRTRVTRTSRVIQTPAWGPVAQGDYLNAAAALTTGLSPRELLDGLLDAERSLGRERSREERWGPRTLDLDLLIHGDHVIDEPGLRIPHPRLTERSFVLVPLAEIAPELVVPGTDRCVREWLGLLSNATAIALSPGRNP